MITKTSPSFLASVLFGTVLWIGFPSLLLAQDSILPPFTFNSLPSKMIASGHTASYTHLLINNGSEPITLTLTAESTNEWNSTVEPSMLIIEANGTKQIEVRHTAPRTGGNGDEDTVTVHVQGEDSETEIVNRTVIDTVYGFAVAVSPEIVYTQPDETVYYDVEIVHLGTLADEISARVIDVTQPLTATVEGGISRILPVSGTLNLRLAVDVPQGTIAGTAATITFTVTSDYLSKERYTRQFTVQTHIGNQPLTPIPTATRWTFPTPEVTNAPTPTSMPLPHLVIGRDTSVWDQPYPAAWILPVTRLNEGDEVTILYEAFDWVEISWDEGDGWIPSTVVAQAIEAEPVPLAVTYSSMHSEGERVMWGVVGTAVCALMLPTLRRHLSRP